MRWLPRSIPMSRHSLRWVAVVVPASFVGVFDLVRHNFLDEPVVPQWYGDVLLFAFLLAGSYLFTQVVFGTIAQLEEKVVERGRILAVLEERERIAREMHDGIAQFLGDVITTTQAVQTLLGTGRAVQARGSIERLETMAHEVYADVREAILGLRSSALRSGGLLEAIREYVPRWAASSGLEVHVQIGPDVQSAYFSPAGEVQILRIIQEALSNVRKHACAALAEVQVSRRQDDILFEVRDNGRGFDCTQVTQDGRPRLGLQTMRERAETVQGTLSIHSVPGGGTGVMLLVPIRQRVAPPGPERSARRSLPGLDTVRVGSEKVRSLQR